MKDVVYHIEPVIPEIKKPVGDVFSATIAGRYMMHIKRHPRLMALNGYIGVPATSHLHGMEYYEIDIPIHGGWSYSEPTLLGETKDGLWWIGFDTMHALDAFDIDAARQNNLREDYIETQLQFIHPDSKLWTLSNVITELENALTIIMQKDGILN